MPVVRLVTPAKTADIHRGVDQFKDQLTDLGWPNNAYETYRTSNARDLAGTAHAAVTDGPAPNVIATDGSLATSLVLGEAGAANIAVVQGVGGVNFSPKPRNLTGYYINTEVTCVNQLQTILAIATATILWDGTNQALHDELDGVARTAGKNNNWVTLAQLTADPTVVVANSIFMLIPNATFYINRRAIARAVDSQNVYAVYPEREYRWEHPHHPDKVKVLGHHVPFTFRRAALLTDQIFRNVVSVAAGNLPAMQEAEKDEDA
jgi:hypothetical protein